MIYIYFFFKLLLFLLIAQGHQHCNSKYSSTHKLNCCLWGVSAKFRTTISSKGRQDAQNVRGHFSKVQRCSSHSSFDSCLGTLCYLLFINIIFNTSPRSHQGFTTKWVQHFQSLGASVCLLQIFWRQLSSAEKSTKYEGFPRTDSGKGCLLLLASVLHHTVHFVRMFLNKYLLVLLPFVSIQPAIQCMPWRHELHRFCALKIPVNGKLLQH